MVTSGSIKTSQILSMENSLSIGFDTLKNLLVLICLDIPKYLISWVKYLLCQAVSCALQY